MKTITPLLFFVFATAFANAQFTVVPIENATACAISVLMFEVNTAGCVHTTPPIVFTIPPFGAVTAVVSAPGMEFVHAEVREAPACTLNFAIDSPEAACGFCSWGTQTGNGGSSCGCGVVFADWMLISCGDDQSEIYIHN